MATLLIHNGWLLPCDGDMRRALRPGYVLARGDRIEAVEAGAAPAALLTSADRVIDAAGKALDPLLPLDSQRAQLKQILADMHEFRKEFGPMARQLESMGFASAQIAAAIESALEFACLDPCK